MSYLLTGGTFDGFHESTICTSMSRSSLFRDILMNACHPLRAPPRGGVAVLVATAAVLMTSSTPVLAVTCDVVRGLTKVEQNYWSQRLNLTPEQRHRIWLECYSQARVTEAKGNSLKPVTNRP